MNNNIEIKCGFERLVKLTTTQIENNFFDLTQEEKDILEKAIIRALDKVEYSFRKCKIKRYKKDGKVLFDPMHAGQNTVYLAFLAHILYSEFNNSDLASYVYYLNKLLNCFEVFYEVELPDVLFLEHPNGSGIGRGTYGDGLILYQSCCIGNNGGRHPKLGKNVVLYSYSCILGGAVIGDNCIISSHAYIKDENIPDNSIVFGHSPNLIIKPLKGKSSEIFE